MSYHSDAGYYENGIRVCKTCKKPNMIATHCKKCRLAILEKVRNPRI